MFKVGDRVMNISEYDSHKGEKGTIVKVQKTCLNQYLVEYDNHINGHSGFESVIGNDGHCWWEREGTIKKIRKGDNMNLLEILCKEIGVETGEEWTGNGERKYMINEYGQVMVWNTANEEWTESYYNLGHIVTEDLKPIWRPEDGEFYYLVDLATPRLYSHTYWCNSFIDEWRLRKGWVFKTSEEAVVAANKILRALEG